MAYKINYIIPQSNCEKITTAITNVVKDEIARQFVLTANNIFDALVYEERFTPFSEEIEKDTLITVHLAQANEVFSNPEFQRMSGNFYVRISHRFTKTVADGDEQTEAAIEDNSDYVSQLAAKKIAHAVRYILQSKEDYDQIDLSVCSMKVKGIEMESPFREDTARNETAGQVLFEVQYDEPVGNIATVDVAGADLATNKFETSTI